MIMISDRLLLQHKIIIIIRIEIKCWKFKGNQSIIILILTTEPNTALMSSSRGLLDRSTVCKQGHTVISSGAAVVIRLWAAFSSTRAGSCLIYSGRDISWL